MTPPTAPACATTSMSSILAEGHLCAIQYAEQHTGCEIFNLGTGRGVSVLEMVNTFSEVNHCPCSPTLSARAAQVIWRPFIPLPPSPNRFLFGKQKDRRRHVPRQLELAEQKPERILRMHKRRRLSASAFFA